jgi:hypothetical protein
LLTGYYRVLSTPGCVNLEMRWVEYPESWKENYFMLSLQKAISYKSKMIIIWSIIIEKSIHPKISQLGGEQ